MATKTSRGLQEAHEEGPGQLHHITLLPVGRLLKRQKQPSPRCKCQGRRQQPYARICKKKNPAGHKDTYVFIFVNRKMVKHWSKAQYGCAASFTRDALTSGQALCNSILLGTACAGVWGWKSSTGPSQLTWLHDLWHLAGSWTSK